MRPDLIDEEYLETERQRIAAKSASTTPRISDRFTDRTKVRPETEKLFKRSVDFQPNNSEFTLVSADQEWVCEKCGAEIPPEGKFCAACGYATGYSTGPRLFANFGTRVKQWFGGINDLAARNGFTPASQIALAVAAFCVGGAIIVQLSIPAASPWFSQVELHEAYALRTLLWLMGSIVSLVAAIAFKRQPGMF